MVTSFLRPNGMSDLEHSTASAEDSELDASALAALATSTSHLSSTTGGLTGVAEVTSKATFEWAEETRRTTWTRRPPPP